ncbi:MAG: MoaD/ThiS family protein [Promethearchaeota archaeon]
MPKIRVNFKAQLVSLLGVETLELDVSPGASVKDVLDKLEEKLEGAGSTEIITANGQLGNGIVLLLEDTDIRVLGTLPAVLYETRLNDGDTLTILSFMHGG